MSENSKKSVIIIGTGLVGSLCAWFMARRGYHVEVYEKRQDPRTAKEVRGKSINLALSHRGRNALRSVDLEEDILKSAIPMKGRFLHGISQDFKSVIYDPIFQNCIFSVGRNYLNKKLLEATNEFSNIEQYFEHSLINCDFAEGTITLLNLKTSKEVKKTADLIIGADGAHSKLRLFMQQAPQFQYTQKYIEHGYLELNIPPENSNKMQPNHLHIWPRGDYMMIALPNQDSSWTVTLFMSFKTFDQLTTNEKVLSFFKNSFPDAIDLIGKEQILDVFLKTRPSQLISIKCSPYHVGSKFLIIGDAAHAMVPFYGQGMNCGFEDCYLLNKLLDKNNDNIELSLDEYTLIRVKNAQAICDLAMYNYLEMSSLVNKTSFRLRKCIDNCLFKMFPDVWIPLYNSVSFSTMDYQQCIENRKWQDNVLRIAFFITGLFIIISLAAIK